jgi:hypothetical protein
METISKQAILDKTHYGLTIYSHILRLYYPDEIVLRLVERDCGTSRNPFNANHKTLHVFIEKENILGNAFDKEFARHEDSENAVSAGDAFSFAELHYKQSLTPISTIHSRSIIRNSAIHSLAQCAV